MAIGLSQQARDRVLEGLGNAKSHGLVLFKVWAKAMAWLTTEAKTKL